MTRPDDPYVVLLLHKLLLTALPGRPVPRAGWIDWYNNRRLHSTLGNVPPVEYEQAHYAALNREPHSV